MKLTEKKVKVSVCVVTYNHEKYIRQCLQSLMDQNTNFIFEVIVGDDASTDGTRLIIEEFVVIYPEIIKPIYRLINIGSVANYMGTHDMAIGDYVAHMDGDDYALAGKLQMQADKFDNNSNINILWHRMEFFNDYNCRLNHPSLNSPFVNINITRADLILYGSFGCHSSMMYRKKLFSLRYENFQVLDWLLSVDFIGDGDGLMMSEVLGAYRVHSGGMSGGARANSKIRELFCNCQLELINRFPEYRSEIALRAFFVVMLDLIAFRSYFTKSLKVFFLSKRFPKIKSIFKLFIFYKYSKLPAEFK